MVSRLLLILSNLVISLTDGEGRTRPVPQGDNINPAACHSLGILAFSKPELFRCLWREDDEDDKLSFSTFPSLSPVPFIR